ncbi:hypothetical protein BO86DRAFT_310588 [Aspergillus japonicus CBS 114.51]|uniref:Uncharacterized protein n=2 Tax=Aspergillus TaxID=5052 RepID=A0A2V5HNR5_ASPV1|nr:hypothetical protein BO86DRAFT_310588 [Aspergillus japonicus CBS 114.51]PYI24242.1 hypothetical protein BO99DRAFT_321485 [Aspergillus violaceofuscus CBS 115571]RAH82955.1 hypothetical protein BO86DRAFT_310588 [Aspergillus japonicus CBS 114.51]
MWPFPSPMLLSLLCFFLSSSVVNSSPSPQLSSADVFYWPAAASEPSFLAQISYNSTSMNSEVVSYSPPTPAHAYESSDLIRIGFFATNSSGSKHWVGTATSWSSFFGDEDHRPTLRLYTKSPYEDELYHVALVSSTTFAAFSTLVSPRVELVSNEAGPRPHLNQPVIIGPDGKNADDVVEKTFFQKYWWIFLIVTFLAMSGGGESQ